MRALAGAMLVLSAAGASAHDESRRFDIPSTGLADALDRFGEQSGLQIIYDQTLLEKRRAPSITGAMSPAGALERLLAGTKLTWRYVNDMTIAIERREVDARPQRAPAPDNTEAFADVEVTEDPQRPVLNESSTSSFGFNKPVLETPRTVSIVSQETIDLLGLSAVEDLVRVVPGVYTTTRFGIQGAVDVRNVPADTYFRGMKRLSLQGNARSVLAAMDTIEVVGGPPSPLYGMGKIGGYTNMVPKSGRAKTGGYLTEQQGFLQTIGGSYGRAELSFGVGGPFNALDKHGGYYVYGLAEDSDSYSDGVPVRQQVLQAAVSVEDFVGSFRLEAGTNYQESGTAGALTGRFTQALVDTGRYVRGTPLANLDTNGNGAIGYLELQHASPVRGGLSVNNQPLVQTWTWPRDAAGKPLPLSKFPKIPGIPQSLYDYLTAHPDADPGGVLRAQGVGGPQPTSGYVPIGMALDPRTVGYDTLDLRRAAAFERELKAQFLTAFADLVYDLDPNFTVKNQVFFDGMHQYKISNQPYASIQDVFVVEDKVTVTHQLVQLPRWLQVNVLASANIRDTVSRGRVNLGDYGTHRTDAMAPGWDSAHGGMTPNTTFADPLDNASLANDGFPWITDFRTEFSEIGLGVLLDTEIFEHTHVLAGGRIDGSNARNVDHAGIFNPTVGTAANPGAFSTAPARASAWDDGVSWSFSLSRDLPYNLRAYATMADASIVLDANNNSLTNAIINAGHIGYAKLRELGLKGSLDEDRIFFSGSIYEQRRADVDASDDLGVINAFATSTRTRGWETEVKWTPARGMFLSLYALDQRTTYDPNIGGTLLVDARTLGFQDVRDASGNVVYPAEAFLYGGRSRIVLPDGQPQYATKQGNPETQLGLNASFQRADGLGVSVSGNHFSSTCSGRLCVVRLPASNVLNTGLFWNNHRWAVKLDIFNLTNERYFRARTGDTLGDALAQAMPGRRWQTTVRVTLP